MAKAKRALVSPSDLSVALMEAVKFLDEQGWNYCLIGGLAASHWGRARRTEDVDFVLSAGFGDERQLAKRMLKNFKPRHSDVVNFAAASRVVMLAASNGVGVDISLGALPFEEEMLERAQRREVLPGVIVRTATAEDIVVMKSVAGRPRDVDDIERIIASQGKRLDLAYIREWLNGLREAFVEDDPAGRFEEIHRSVQSRMESARSSVKASPKKAAVKKKRT